MLKSFLSNLTLKYKIALAMMLVFLATFCILQARNMWINYGIERNKAVVEKLVKDNTLLDSRLKELDNLNTHKTSEINQLNEEKEKLVVSFEKLDYKLAKLNKLSENKAKQYEDRIYNVTVDNTNIYSRCIRTCAAAAKLGTEFSCADNFCEQFSGNSPTASTTKK